jgi:hypothetical protein
MTNSLAYSLIIGKHMPSSPTPKKELYPTIADIIIRRYRQTRDWVSRDEIISELLSGRESASIIKHDWELNLAKIKAGKKYQDWETVLENYAGNWIDWFSKQFEYEGYHLDFRREKDNENKWVYMPK